MTASLPFWLNNLRKAGDEKYTLPPVTNKHVRPPQENMFIYNSFEESSPPDAPSRHKRESVKELDTREYGTSDTKYARPGVPHGRKAPPLSSLQRTVEQSPGLAYEDHALIPPGKYESGVYADEYGQRWHVKRGVVHSIHHLHDLLYGNHDNNINPKEIDHTPLTQNAAARHEYTVHKLYKFFSTPQNNIRVMNASLHSDKNRGAPVDQNHKWNDNTPAYFVTPELFGRNGMRGVTMDSRSSPNLKKDMYKQLFGGLIVDALFDASNMSGKNVMSVPGEDGVYRVDHSGAMGMHPLGYQRRGFGTFHDSSVLERTLLPSIPRLFRQYIKGMGGISSRNIEMIGNNILLQAQQVVQKFDLDRHGVANALRHASNKEQLEQSLANRIEVLRKMLAAYAGKPKTLVHDLSSGGLTATQERLRRSQRGAEQIPDNSKQWDNSHIGKKTVRRVEHFEEKLERLLNDILKYHETNRGPWG